MSGKRIYEADPSIIVSFSPINNQKLLLMRGTRIGARMYVPCEICGAEIDATDATIATAGIASDWMYCDIILHFCSEACAERYRAEFADNENYLANRPHAILDDAVWVLYTGRMVPPPQQGEIAQ